MSKFVYNRQDLILAKQWLCKMSICSEKQWQHSSLSWYNHFIKYKTRCSFDSVSTEIIRLDLCNTVGLWPNDSWSESETSTEQRAFDPTLPWKSQFALMVHQVLNYSCATSCRAQLWYCQPLCILRLVPHQTLAHQRLISAIPLPDPSKVTEGQTMREHFIN